MVSDDFKKKLTECYDKKAAGYIEAIKKMEHVPDIVNFDDIAREAARSLGRNEASSEEKDVTKEYYKNYFLGTLLNAHSFDKFFNLEQNDSDYVDFIDFLGKVSDLKNNDFYERFINILSKNPSDRSAEEKRTASEIFNNLKEMFTGIYDKKSKLEKLGINVEYVDGKITITSSNSEINTFEKQLIPVANLKEFAGLDGKNHNDIALNTYTAFTTKLNEILNSENSMSSEKIENLQNMYNKLKDKKDLMSADVDIVVKINYDGDSIPYRISLSNEVYDEIKDTLFNTEIFEMTKERTILPEPRKIGETVEDYEKYLFAFYQKTAPQFLPINNVFDTKRSMYPHESTDYAQFHHYYENEYTVAFEEKKRKNSNNLYTGRNVDVKKYLSKLRKLNVLDSDDLKDLIDLIPDDENFDNKVDLIGFSCKRENLATIQKLVYGLGLDLEGYDVRILPVPFPRTKNANESIVDYEKYLAQHYKNNGYDKGVIGDEIKVARMPYPHEKPYIWNGKKDVKGTISKDGYYYSEYLKYIKDNNIINNTPYEYGKKIAGKRKVTKKVKFSEKENIDNILDKVKIPFRQKLHLANTYPEGGKDKQIYRIIKNVAIGVGVGVILVNVTPALLTLFGGSFQAIFSAITGVGVNSFQRALVVKYLKSALLYLIGFGVSLVLLRKALKKRKLSMLSEQAKDRDISTSNSPSDDVVNGTPQDDVQQVVDEIPTNENLNSENFLALLEDAIRKYVSCKHQYDDAITLSNDDVSNGLNTDNNNQLLYDQVQNAKHELVDKIIDVVSNIPIDDLKMEGPVL